MKEELLRELEEAHREFVAEIEDLDERAFDEKWYEGRWGVRELAAQLTGWHGQFASGFERLARGEPLNPPGQEWPGVDDLDETFALHAKGKLKDEVLFELERAVEHFVGAARKLPDEAFDEGRVARELVDRAGVRKFREYQELISEHLSKQAAGPPSSGGTS